MSSSAMPCREEQCRIYASYLECSGPARQAIEESGTYKAKLASAKARHKEKYRRRDLQDLRQDVSSQVSKTCADSLRPLEALKDTVCRDKLDQCRKARDCWDELYRRNAEVPVEFEEIIDAKVRSRSARQELYECEDLFLKQLRAEL